MNTPGIDTATTSTRYGGRKQLPTLRLDELRTRSEINQIKDSSRSGVKSVTLAKRRQYNLTMNENEFSSYQPSKQGAKNYCEQ